MATVITANLFDLISTSLDDMLLDYEISAFPSPEACVYCSITNRNKYLDSNVRNDYPRKRTLGKHSGALKSMVSLCLACKSEV